MEVSKGLAAVAGIIIGSLDLSLAAVLKLNEDFIGREVVHGRDAGSHTLYFALGVGVETYV